MWKKYGQWTDRSWINLGLSLSCVLKWQGVQINQHTLLRRLTIPLAPHVTASAWGVGMEEEGRRRARGSRGRRTVNKSSLETCAFSSNSAPTAQSVSRSYVSLVCGFMMCRAMLPGGCSGNSETRVMGTDYHFSTDVDIRVMGTLQYCSVAIYKMMMFY